MAQQSPCDGTIEFTEYLKKYANTIGLRRRDWAWETCRPVGSWAWSIASPNADKSRETLWRSLLDQASLDPDMNAGNIALCCEGVVHPMNQLIDLMSNIEVFPIVKGG